MTQVDSYTQPPGLTLEDVHKSFGQARIIKGVSMSISPGEFHVLIGPNGAGKSTLFNLISGRFFAKLRPHHAGRSADLGAFAAGHQPHGARALVPDHEHLPEHERVRKHALRASGPDGCRLQFPAPRIVVSGHHRTRRVPRPDCRTEPVAGCAWRGARSVVAGRG